MIMGRRHVYPPARLCVEQNGKLLRALVGDDVATRCRDGQTSESLSRRGDQRGARGGGGREGYVDDAEPAASDGGGVTTA